jgi:ribosome-associated protein
MSETKNSATAPLAGKPLVEAAIEALQDALALNIVTIDIRHLPGATDWFVICEGDNTVHNRACADRVIDHLRDRYATRPWQREGLDEGRWVLLDYSDVVVHIMLNELREFYDLEALWSSGTLTKVDEQYPDDH